MNSVKLKEEQFSTLQFQDSKGYSSRYLRSKNKTKIATLSDSLPHKRQKAAITIQRFWRLRMALRRIYYQQLLQQLIYENQVDNCIVSKLQNMLNGINMENLVLDHYIQNNVESKTSQSKKYMKNIAKQCVGITFKFQKKMIGEKELKNFLEEKQKVKSRVCQLKQYKEQLGNWISEHGKDDEQVLLRQIRQANSQLLKIVNEKNKLKHELREKQLQTSHQSYSQSII